MNDVMNLAQLAAYLQMSRASVYHLVAAGKVPGTKVGKQWRFSRTTIDKWLEGTKTPSSHVLVVEDDPVVRDLVLRALRNAGHHSVGARSVGQALTLLQEIEFDVVLLDLLLPDGTGLDVVAATSQMAAPPEILVVTGHPDHDVIERIRCLLPYITVLNKPVRLETLLELIARVTAGKQQAKGSPQKMTDSLNC